MLGTIERPLPGVVKKSASMENTTTALRLDSTETNENPSSSSSLLHESVVLPAQTNPDDPTTIPTQPAVAPTTRRLASGRSRRSNSDIPAYYIEGSQQRLQQHQRLQQQAYHHQQQQQQQQQQQFYGHPFPYPPPRSMYPPPPPYGHQQQQLQHPPSATVPDAQQLHHEQLQLQQQQYSWQQHQNQQLFYQQQQQQHPMYLPPPPPPPSSSSQYYGSLGNHYSSRPAAGGPPPPSMLPSPHSGGPPPGVDPYHHRRINHNNNNSNNSGPPPIPTTTRSRDPFAAQPHHQHRMTNNPANDDTMDDPDESRPLLPASAIVERRKASREQRSRRRKALSSSAADPNYGAFWNKTNSLTIDQQQQQQQRDDVPMMMNGRTAGAAAAIPPSLSMSYRPVAPPTSMLPSSQKFSPRSEFRKLAKGISPTASPLGSSSIHRKGGGFPGGPAMSDLFATSQEESIRLLTRTMSERPHPVRGESWRKMQERQETAQNLVNDIKGVEQPLLCRNVFFLLLFVFHLVFLIYLGERFGIDALEDHSAATSDDDLTIDYSNLVYIACWSGLFAVFISALLLGAMTYFARHFVQIALFVIIFLSFAWGTIGVGVSPKTAVPVTGIIALGLAVAYTFIVWDRIPFAAANLVTALSGIRDFPGIVVVAFGLQAVALLWSACFSVVVFGVYTAMQKRETPPRLAYVVYVLLGISLNWTFQVIQGTVHAITAGVIGGWWYHGNSEENSGLVRKSAFKTIFYSMGSICFGSLFVGPVRILRLFSVLFRPSSSDDSSLVCLHQCVHCIQSCMTSFVDSISASYNTWAYTYIGMYHYGFLDAGHHATDLFEKIGWTTIVSDDLVPNVLFFTSLVIGGITGCFAFLLSRIDRLAVLNSNGEAGLAPFVEGVIIGLVLPSVVFGLISSSVNTVLVSFASSPLDFERRHPQLSHEMRSAWREVWPGALDVSRERFTPNTLRVDC